MYDKYSLMEVSSDDISRMPDQASYKINRLVNGVRALSDKLTSEEIGLQSIEQTTTSTADGGTNVITATLADGSTSQFYIRNGSKGSQGEQGPRGLQGIQGETGPQGPTGATGATGAQGPQGEAGPAGPANTLSIGTVTSGATADATITGTSPNQTLNLVLPQGPQGPQGETGATGPQGPAGQDANTVNSYSTSTTDAYSCSYVNGLLDLFYPVGSYYETSDTSFDPNVSWGGTWVEDSAGRATVAQDAGTFSTVGGTGGSETVTISSANLPTHTHTYDKANGTSGQASGNTGSTTLTIDQIPSHNHGGNTGDQYGYDNTNIYASGSGSGNDNFKIISWNNNYIGDDARLRDHFKHKHSVSSQGGGQGHTHTLNSHTHTVSTTSTNSGNGGFSNTAMTNLQPYIIVRRWHRTA